jgi:ribosome assembly protein YihI (activator of Der GTPase)
MRLIKEMVRAILKLLFNIDTEAPTAELLENSEWKATMDELLDMVDNGRINEAENKVYEITENMDNSNLEMALLFYSYLNDKSDDFLENNNFSRDEVMQGLKTIAVKYGIENMVEIFLQ